MKIEDGTGKGTLAKVSAQNHLLVDGVTIPEITHISSSDENAFAIHAEVTLVAANTFEDIMHLTYNGNYKLQVESLLMSREDVALASSGQSVFEMMTNTTYTSGGLVAIPTNMNLGSSNTLDATVYSGATALVIGKANEIEVLDVVVRTLNEVDFDGALILNKGDTLAVIGKSKNISDVLHITLTCYEVQVVI